MEAFFYNKLKHRHDRDLRVIVANKESYEPEAVNAAIALLNERAGNIVALIPPGLPGAAAPLRSMQAHDSLAPFSFALFFKTHSYRDYLTAFSLSLFFIAFSELLKYYSNERWLEGNAGLFQSLGFLAAFLFAHILYKIEHGRPNNFVGRATMDVVMLFMLFLVGNTYAFLTGGNHFHFSSTDFSTAVASFFIIGFSILVLEGILSMVALLLALIKCRIF